MITSLVLAAMLSPVKVGGFAEVNLIETLNQTSRTKTEFEGSSTFTETSTRTDTKWRLSGSIPFTEADWNAISFRSLLRLKVDKREYTKPLLPMESTKLTAKSFAVNIDVPVVQDEGWKLITRPGDVPPAPVKPGTRRVIAKATFRWKADRLEFVIDNVDRSHSLVASSMVDLGTGQFESSSKFELGIANAMVSGEIPLSGKTTGGSRGNFENSSSTSRIEVKGKANLPIGSK